jgi:hypothetical protein
MTTVKTADRQIHTPTGADVVNAALAARTLDDAVAVNDMLALRIGARYLRPVADRVSTHGLLTSGGRNDHKLIELVTNIHDPVLELLARQRFGSLDHVPYTSPHEAARELLGNLSRDEQAELCRIDTHEAEPPARKTKRITFATRDKGCGITPAYVPKSIFYAGSIHKDAHGWMQGAFGMGGTTTYPAAGAVILVTRRHPDLLEPGEGDVITIAVCEWRRNVKGRGLFYLVEDQWPDNPDALPHSVPASEVPDFEPGTYLALVSYQTEGLHTGRNDRNSFEFVFNTRLFDPVIPVRLHNHVARGDHAKRQDGLRRRFAENPRDDREHFARTMPFRIGGKTYQLPLDIYYFRESPGSDKGAMRNFVAAGHTVCFASNGQVHRHWTSHEFRGRMSKLPKLADRLLVMVSLDPIPIDTRTSLVTPDRSGFVAKDDTDKLEEATAAYLEQLDELRERNNDIIRETIAKRHSDRPTVAIAHKIARALKLKGFTLSGPGADEAGGGRKQRKRWAKADLYADPTALEGPDRITALPGETRFLRYHLNAIPDFLSLGRGKLEVISDCPSLGDNEIVVGDVIVDGMVTVSIVVPDTTPEGTCRLCAGVTGWQKTNGSIGPNLTWDTEIQIVSERPRREPKPKTEGGEGGGRGGKTPRDGALVALLWRQSADVDDWHEGVPGHVEEIEAQVLAEDDAYAELKSLGERTVPTVLLNEDYSPLTKYEAGRAKDASQRAFETARDRYSVGVGLGLLLHDKEMVRRRKAGEATTDEADLADRQAVSRSVLAMLPEYDELAREAGID